MSVPGSFWPARTQPREIDPEILLDQRPVAHRHKALDDSVDGIFVGRWKKLAAESAHQK
jgi:hypothetical protein